MVCLVVLLLLTRYNWGKDPSWFALSDNEDAALCNLT